MHLGGRAAGRAFSGVIFWGRTCISEIIENPADLSVFRQEHRDMILALPLVEATSVIFVTRNFFSGAAGHDLPQCAQTSQKYFAR